MSCWAPSTSNVVSRAIASVRDKLTDVSPSRSIENFAIRNGREEIKFIAGDYPADIRQLIHDGKIFGTVDQDPYPQAYEAMHMAYLLLNGKEAEIAKPYFLPLPLVTKENAEQTPPAWGC